MQFRGREACAKFRLRTALSQLRFTTSLYVAGVATRAQSSYLGIALLAAAALVMPWLGWQKRRLAQEAGSSALRADAAQSSLNCRLATRRYLWSWDVAPLKNLSPRANCSDPFQQLRRWCRLGNDLKIGTASTSQFAKTMPLRPACVEQNLIPFNFPQISTCVAALFSVTPHKRITEF